MILKKPKGSPLLCELPDLHISIHNKNPLQHGRSILPKAGIFVFESEGIPLFANFLFSRWNLYLSIY